MMPGKTRQHRRFSVRAVPVIAVLVLVTVVGVLTATVRESVAIPAWARKYNADCAMCHYAAYPRLNSFGLQFRRMGYRTPAEVNKDQDMTNVSHFLTGRLRTQLAYENTKGAIERSEFRFPEAALIYAGAFSRHYSAYIHGFADNGSNVDLHGHIQGMFGDEHKFFMVRIGQMHMLQQEGIGGFDRPVGITTTPVHASPLTRSTAPSVFHFDLRQKGAELSYVYGPGRLFGMISNGLDESGSGTRRVGDVDPQKDVLVGYDHILDDIASGFTLFYYNGTTHATVAPVFPAVPAGLSQTFSYSRFGFNVNKIFTVPGTGFFELMGGFARSYDNVPIQRVGGDVQGNAFYVESQQYLTGPELTFFERFSLIDLDGPRANSTRKDYTFGAVTPVETWLRVAAEYTYTDNRFTGLYSHLALLEVQAIW
jgi:hypothetical protein